MCVSVSVMAYFGEIRVKAQSNVSDSSQRLRRNIGFGGGKVERKLSMIGLRKTTPYRPVGPQLQALDTGHAAINKIAPMERKAIPVEDFIMVRLGVLEI